MKIRKYVGYVVISDRFEDAEYFGFTYGTDLDRIIAQQETAETTDRDDAQATTTDTKDTKTLNLLVTRIVENSHSQYELLSISRVLSGLYPYMVFQRNVVKKFVKDDAVVHRSGSLTVYGVSDVGLGQLRAARERVDRANKGVEVLPSATLLSMIATFDSTMAELLREVFTLRPQLLKTGTKSINFADVLSARDIEELKDRILDEEVYQFSRESHEKQVQIMEERFGFRISEKWKRWPDFIEIFERRNLIAHGEKVFTKRYVSICKRHNHKGSENLLGQQIRLQPPYLQQSADVLLEFSLLLIFEIWRKHFPLELNEVTRLVNNIAVKLISDNRSRVVDWVLEYTTKLQGTKISDEMTKMMVINLASARQHLKQSAQCEATLNDVDWSGSSYAYKICVAALRRDVPEVLKIMPIVVNSNEVTKAQFREWPVFDFVREDDGFKSKFSELFGETVWEDDAAKVEVSTPAAATAEASHREPEKSQEKTSVRTRRRMKTGTKLH